jgi:hypothetical protein
MNCMGIFRSPVSVFWLFIFPFILAMPYLGGNEFWINKSIGYPFLKLSVMPASCFPVYRKTFGDIFPMMHIFWQYCNKTLFYRKYLQHTLN